jgi:hypothetical protein
MGALTVPIKNMIVGIVLQKNYNMETIKRIENKIADLEKNGETGSSSSKTNHQKKIIKYRSLLNNTKYILNYCQKNNVAIIYK